MHPWCLAKKHIWTTTAPLLCFQIVEYYHSERVMWPFGLLQRCPKWLTDNFDKSVHCVKLTGKSSVNWHRHHAQYYGLWNERVEHVVGDDNFHLGVDYTTWSPIHNTRGGCPYVPGYYFSFFNNTVLILITNYLHKQNTALILITNYFFSFFNNIALINVFFSFYVAANWDQ